MGKSSFDFGDDGLDDDLELARPLDFNADSADDDASPFGDGLDFDNVDFTGGPRVDGALDEPANFGPPRPSPAHASDGRPPPLDVGSDENYESGHTFKPDVAPDARPADPDTSAPAVLDHPPRSTPGHTIFESAAIKPPNMTMVLGVVAGVMVVFALLLIMTSGSSNSEIADDHFPEEPVYSAPVREVVHVRTSPPALRILVNGQSRGTSPVELRLSAADYPLTITAVLNQSTSRDQIITKHQPEVLLDLSDLIR